MLLNLREEDELLTTVTHNLDDLEKFLEDVRAWAHSQNTWTLEGTILLPPGDALLAEKFAAVVALHRVL